MSGSSDPALRKPRFRPSMVARVVDPDQVYLLTETQRFILFGVPYRAVAPFIDGTRTPEEILEAAAPWADMPRAMFALQQLEKKGYLSEGGDAPYQDGVGAWWSMLGETPSRASERVATARVSLRFVGECSAAARSAVGAALSGAGLTVTDDAATHQVVITDDYRRRDLAEIDAAARASGTPWLLARIAGVTPWIGPVFAHGDQACWTCLAHRLDGNRPVERYVEAFGDAAAPVVTARSESPATLGLSAQLVASLVEQWVVAGAVPSVVRDVVRTYDVRAWSTAEHQLTRRPQCPVCGDAALRDPARAPTPIALRSRPKRFVADGGHRTLPPEDTYRRLERHVSPVTGVVSSLVRKDEKENGLTFSYATGHDFVLAERDVATLRANMRFRSGGKGMSEIQARVSGICEAVERYAGVWRGDEPRVRGTQKSIGDSAVHVNDVLLFSDAQYDGRRQWNAQCSPTRYHHVYEPFDPDLTIDWTAAWSLTNNAWRHVPSALCYYGHPDARYSFCGADANGTAAGNTIEEAILQGFLELVERDAVAMWWYGRVQRPGVDLASFSDPYVDALRGHYASLGRDLWVLDLTNDLGIPVFAAVSPRVDGPPEDILVSFGAHWDARIALTRSLTEVNQFLPAVSRRNADGTTRYAYDDPDALAWWTRAKVSDEPYLAPAPGESARTRADHAHVPLHRDLRDDVQACVAAAARAGLETLVIDQTRPDVDLAVVRVIVPGLRHFWRRLGPGRLYDVPVQLGWCSTPLAEADVNPHSMFF